MRNGPTNHTKFHRRKHDKFYLKDTYFLCGKTLRNGIEMRQDRYLSMRSLSNRGPRVVIWHSYFGLAKFLDNEHKHYWTSVALYYKVAFRGILASIIEMLLYGKQCVSHGYYCCKNKNYSHLPRLQKKHSLRPCAKVCLSTTRFSAAACWWKSEPLLRPLLCDQNNNVYLPRTVKSKQP